ncbi:MAG: ABC transporter permease [Bacteriovorax sp.]|nr:ABC transporter permease [Bacteriovorax sp.]
MIFLAIRYLVERKRQTILTLLGVFFGTMAFVSVSGYFLGFQGYLVQQLVNNNAQVHIEARQDYLTDHDLDQSFFGSKNHHVFWNPPPAGVKGYLYVQSPQMWYKRLTADPRVAAYSPILTAAALFNIGKISVAANLIGCDPTKQSKVTTISDYMIAGKFADIGVGGNRIILGNELMKRLGAGIQQTVLVSVGTNSAVPFKVVGRFYTGSRGIDLQAYGALADVQRANRTPNQVNEIGVRLKDYKEADTLSRTWSKLASERVESWGDLNLNVKSIFSIQNALRFSMIMTILIVAGFGIYNILNMTVNQKRQDIAILRALGYDTFDIIILFFSQGLIVGVCGTVLGLICGYLFCRYIQTITFLQMTPSNPQGHLHIALTPLIYIQAATLALLSTSIASILPARAAGKLTPIEIIRQGG